MTLLDKIKKSRQVEPISEDPPASTYKPQWNSHKEYNKHDSFVHVPLSPPTSRYTRYRRQKNGMKINITIKNVYRVS